MFGDLAHGYGAPVMSQAPSGCTAVGWRPTHITPQQALGGRGVRRPKAKFLARRGQRSRLIARATLASGSSWRRMSFWRTGLPSQVCGCVDVRSDIDGPGRVCEAGLCRPEAGRAASRMTAGLEPWCGCVVMTDRRYLGFTPGHEFPKNFRRVSGPRSLWRCQAARKWSISARKICQAGSCARRT